MKHSLARKRVWMFVAVTFALTCLLVFAAPDFVNRTNSRGGAALLMLIPTVGMLLTRFALR